MRRISFYLATISGPEVLRLLAAAPMAVAFQSREGERKRFEAHWTERFGCRGASAFPSARSALTATLRAGGVGPGDDVLATGFTCTAVAEAIVAAGARPIWIDIEPARFGISPEMLNRAATSNCKAVVVQHTFGLISDVSCLKRAARKRDLLVIEDSCHALGSGRAGVEAGSSGDASVVSFELSKTISAGWGGIAQGNSDEMAASLKQIQSQAGTQPRSEACSRLLQVAVYSAAYSPGLGRLVGYPAALLEKLGVFKNSSRRTSSAGAPLARAILGHRYIGAQADAHWSALIPQFHRLDTVLVAHRAAVAKYRSVLSRCGVGGWLAWMDPDEVLIRFPLMIKNPERMISTFAKRGIECGRWFDYPLSPAPADPSAFNYTPGQCKTAEQVSRHIINLPTHPRLAATDLENVCAALDGYLGERAEERDFISDWTERAHAALVVELQV